MFIARLRLSCVALPSAYLGVVCGVLSLGLFLSPAAGAEPLTAASPRHVRVGGELGRRIEMTVGNNLLKINHDTDFIESFRKKDRAPFSYVGLGKEIDATVRFAYYSGNPAIIALKSHLVAETIKTQLPDGYMGIFADVPPSDEPPELGEGGRLQVWWDIHELSYLILGLVSDYQYFDNQQALAAARRAADYIMDSRPATPLVVHVSTTGLELAFLALYDATGETKYRDYVNLNNSLGQWTGDVVGHAYNHLSVCLAQLELHRQQNNPRLLRQSHRVLDYLLEDDGLILSGSCSRNEGWHTNQQDTGKTAETCATAYYLRWLGRMMEIEARPLYGDLMEQAIYNALFAAQSLDGRELRKYTPLTGRREFYEGEPSSAFRRDTYCCPNNYRRIVAELPGMIYYLADDALVVNLYTTSQLEARFGGVPVRVTQQTRYPSGGTVAFSVYPENDVEFALKLRIPRWCEGATVRVNGQPAEGQVAAGEFFVVQRRWQKGDRVHLQMLMKPRWIEGTKMHQGDVALAYGPLLFCVNPARQSENVRQRLASAEMPKAADPTADTQAADAKPAPHALAAPVAIRPATLSGPERNATVRPGSVCFRVRLHGDKLDGETLLLTEFTDPGGEWTFLVPASSGKSE